MYTFGPANDRKHTLPNTYIPGQYLLLASEPRDVRIASRGSYGFRNRYLLKRQLVRTLKRMKSQ